jgi:hypothetical protein
MNASTVKLSAYAPTSGTMSSSSDQRSSVLRGIEMLRTSSVSAIAKTPSESATVRS